MWANDIRKTKMSYLYIQRLIYNTYFMYHTKFPMLNDFRAILWRVEYFSFFQNAMCLRWHVQHYSRSTVFLVMFIHLGGCQKILNLGEMVCLAHQICDWWFGSMGRCLMGDHSNLNIVPCSVMYIGFMRWSSFFSYLLRLSFGVKTVTKSATLTQFAVMYLYDEGLTVNWNSQKTFCRLVYGAQNCFYKKWYLVYFTA